MSRLNPDGLGGMPPLDAARSSMRSVIQVSRGLESFDQILQRTLPASVPASNLPSPPPLEPASRDDQNRRRPDDHDSATSTMDHRDASSDRPSRDDYDESIRADDRPSRDTSNQGAAGAPSETSATSRADSSEDSDAAGATTSDDNQEAAAVDDKASSDTESADDGASGEGQVDAGATDNQESDRQADVLDTVAKAQEAVELVDAAGAETDEATVSVEEQNADSTDASHTDSRQAEAAQQTVDAIQDVVGETARGDQASAVKQKQEALQDAAKAVQLDGVEGVETRNAASAARVDETTAVSKEVATQEAAQANTPGKIAAEAVEVSAGVVVESEVSNAADRNGGKARNARRPVGRHGPVGSTDSNSQTAQATAAASQTEAQVAAQRQVDTISSLMDTAAATKTATVATTEGDSDTSTRPTAATEASRTTATNARQRAAATSAANQGEQVDRARFVQRVSRAFQGLGQEGGTVRLRLHPAELGSLSLEVRVREGLMTARVETETSAARALLLDNLPALRERLAEHNIKVDRFDVELTGQGAGEAPEQSDDQRQPNDQSPRSAPRSGSDSAAESDTPVRRAVSVASDGGGQLDIVV